jgi:hypothetical protein
MKVVIMEQTIPLLYKTQEEINKLFEAGNMFCKTIPMATDPEISLNENINNKSNTIKYEYI